MARPRLQFKRNLSAAMLAGGIALAVSACGGEPPLALSPDATEGREIANANGCAACHGRNGQGVTAPSWQGLYNESVPLEDGTAVIADDAYLARSITDPQAEIVDGFTLKMPQNGLDDAEIELVIAYIRELS